jgi:hypothetical protein
MDELAVLVERHTADSDLIEQQSTDMNKLKVAKALKPQRTSVTNVIPEVKVA